MLQDLRFALRLARKNPGTALTTFLVLVLAIGGTTAIFSIVDAVLFRPLPFADSSRILRIFATDAYSNRDDVSMPDYLDWKKNVRGFSSTALFGTSQATLTGGGLPERVVLGRCEASLFSLLGVIPVRGRNFQDDENQPGHAAEAILSWKFWQRHFNGQDVLGQKLMLDGKPFVIVGIAPKSLSVLGRRDVWVPLTFDLAATANKRGFHSYEAFGRLEPNVTIGQIDAQLASRSAALARAFPNENKGVGARAAELQGTLTGEGLGSSQANFRSALLLLLCAVGALLLIACGNVANLNLVTASSRRHELAIRIAVGARPGRLFRQVLLEGVLLSLAAAICGVGLAWTLIRVFKSLPVTAIPRLEEIGVNGRALAFTLIVGVVTGVLCALIPAFRASLADLGSVLKQGSGRTTDSRSQQNLRRLFVAMETALAALLLVQSGLLLASFLRVVSINPDLADDHLLTLYFSVPGFNAAHLDNESIPALVQQILEHVEAVPGVRSAATTSTLPLTGTEAGGGVIVEGNQLARQIWAAPYAVWTAVSPHYFQTMQIRLLAGDDFGPGSPGKKIAIVNQTLAAKLFRKQNPIGKRISPAGPSPDWHQIIGIAADVPQEAIEKKPAPEMFVPSEATDTPWIALALRVRGDPRSYIAPVRRAIADVNGSVAVFLPRTMKEIVNRQYLWRGLQTSVIGAFAALAVALSGMGIYAVIAHSVNQRVREIGLRMALGASNGAVLRMILLQGTLPAVIGLTIGLAASLAISRFIASILFGVGPFDPAIYLSAAALLFAAALAATYFPARRASLLDPGVALREE